MNKPLKWYERWWFRLRYVDRYDGPAWWQIAFWSTVAFIWVKFLIFAMKWLALPVCR